MNFMQSLVEATLARKKVLMIAASVIVLAVVAWRMAAIIWLVATPSAAVPTTAIVAGGPSQASDADNSRLKSLKLFRSDVKLTDQPAQVAARPNENLADTRLNLSLSAIMSANPADASRAIVVVNNKQHLIKVGQAVPVNGRVLLAEVHPKYVVLTNNGKRERLVLDEKETAELGKLVQSNSPSLPMNAKSITELVSFTPVLKGATLDAVRLSPANNQAAPLFDKAGLREGDELFAVDGKPVTLNTNVAQLGKRLAQGDAIKLSIRRQGKLQVITLSADKFIDR